VRRVLRDDGTVWLVTGDSYNAAGRTGQGTRQGYTQSTNRASAAGVDLVRSSDAQLKPKDLIGVPWRVAFALQQPYEVVTIKDRADRAWLAALIDGEGCITTTVAKPTTGVNESYAIVLQVRMSDRECLDRVVAITGMSHVQDEVTPPSHVANGQRPVFCWKVAGDKAAAVLAEILPYLFIKRHQAIAAWNLQRLKDGVVTKRGVPVPAANMEQRRELHRVIRALNQREGTDIPGWCREPSFHVEPGWYLRSDVIWAKPNPMPESVQGSHYSRHRVTIAEYERLSGLRYVDECAGDAWAGDMPSLSEREVFSRQAPLRAAEQGQIRSDREGQADPRQGARQIQGDTEGAADRCATTPAHEGSPARATEAMPLLHDGAETHTGSCHSAQQGRTAHQGERGAGMRPVQFQETGSDTEPVLVGCPGCPKCLKHHGYLFHLSAGRPTRAHECVFLLTKSKRYYYDAKAVEEPAISVGKRLKMADNWDTGPGGHGAYHRGGRGRGKSQGAIQAQGRNRRTVWTIATQPYRGAHFAAFPEKLVEPCILAGCPPGGRVLDPFVGSGTVVQVAQRLGRVGVGVDLKPEYLYLAQQRVGRISP